VRIIECKYSFSTVLTNLQSIKFKKFSLHECNALSILLHAIAINVLDQTMLFILTFLSLTSSTVWGVCPRPPFAGDPTSAMYPAQMLKRAARRPTLPSDADVYSSVNVMRIQRVLPESKFKSIFPRANEGRGPGVGNGPYTYFNFLKAASMWPSFCNEAARGGTDLDALCLKELASMFAHFSQEVGEHDAYSQYPMWQQGLYYYNELGCSNDPSVAGCEYRGGTCDASTWMGQIWQCPAGVKYFGRGAKQLSYNFNYGPFSYALFGDVNVLLKNPALVTSNDATNGWLALASAFWFYMTPQSPKPSMHDVVTGFWTPSTGDIAGKRVPGFGVLIMIINGGIECGGQTEIQQAANRIDFYKNFLTALGLPQDDPTTLGCAKMQQFDSSSSAFTPSYWEQSWSTQSCGVSCQLVSYQTGFSIFDDPLAPDIPYNKCIQYYFSGSTTASPQPGSSTSTTSRGAGTSCSTCGTCVSVPGNSQAATDAQCAPCGSGTLQTWWPCNVDGLCQCATETSSSTSTTKAPTTTTKVTTMTVASSTTPSPSTSKPSTSTSLSTTTKATTLSATTLTTQPASTSSTRFSSPCATCATCVSVPGNIQAATDAQCSPCGSGTLQSWWPCNVSGLCQCATSGSTTFAPQTSTTRVSSSSATQSPSVNPCAQCVSCEAIPGNSAGAIDDHCVPCGSQTLQTWWPCNQSGICRCKSSTR
jgi:hypothetical protein